MTERTYPDHGFMDAARDLIRGLQDLVRCYVRCYLDGGDDDDYLRACECQECGEPVDVTATDCFQCGASLTPTEAGER